MNSVTSFLSLLSAASLVLAALCFLLPKGAAESKFKYAAGIFIISLIISTFNVSFADFKGQTPVINTNRVIATAENISNSTAEIVLRDLLTRCNIKFKEIEIIMDNSNSSDINITKARIELVNEDDFIIAAEIVKNQTGIILVR